MGRAGAGVIVLRVPESCCSGGTVVGPTRRRGFRGIIPRVGVSAVGGGGGGVCVALLFQLCFASRAPLVSYLQGG
jgi:hypothetical protein